MKRKFQVRFGEQQVGKSFPRGPHLLLTLPLMLLDISLSSRFVDYFPIY